MVGTIVIESAAAGLGMLAGVAAADRCSSATTGSQLPFAGAGGARPSCATCGGTGKVACCLCGRWSDGDVGCRTCSGSGRTACPSCRGSGTGRRAPVRVAVRAHRPPVARFRGQ